MTFPNLFFLYIYGYNYGQQIYKIIMKKSTLRQIIREEIQNLTESKEYTVKDLHKLLKRGEDIQISTDGGHSSKVFKSERWHDTKDQHVKDFEDSVLKNRYYKDKKFVEGHRKNYFVAKDSKSGAGDFYDKGGRYKGD